MATTARETRHRATKHEFGWLYRGHLIDHAVNENCDYTREWRISEKDSSGDWEVLDQFSTLKVCKEIVDGWKESEAKTTTKGE